VYEKVIERRIRELVKLHDNQFGFRPGRDGRNVHNETSGENVGRKQQEILDLCRSGRDFL